MFSFLFDSEWLIVATLIRIYSYFSLYFPFEHFLISFMLFSALNNFPRGEFNLKSHEC